MSDPKILKAGSEAPAVKVYDIQGEGQIIGMIAVNVQLLVYLNSLTDSLSASMVKALDEAFKDAKKLNIGVVVKEEASIATFVKEHTLASAGFSLYADKDGSFAKKFRVESGNSFCNAFFIVDKEGEIKLAYYSYNNDYVALDEIIGETKSWVAYKPKGHVHENWMM